MEILKVENLSFTYPGQEKKALDNVNLHINRGAFVTFCGKSGCGKTTLLRLLKSAISPFGDVQGSIWFDGQSLADVDAKTQAEKIGFVLQSPENQIVTDKVWHELAFGLESLGYKTPEIRARVAEMASFFGIQDWFYKNVTDLSGGQKQLLNLASVMVMQPSLLILDEPTSQLDPIAASTFLKTLEKINRELGTTILLSEHRLEEAFAMSDKVVVLDEGSMLACAEPKQIGEILKAKKHDMFMALPTPMRVHGALTSGEDCPITVRDGRTWLEAYTQSHTPNSDCIPACRTEADGDVAIELKDVWFRYEKELPDVVKGLNLTIRKGELFAVVGGNGTGKTTALSLISGLNKPYRGEVFLQGKLISKVANLYDGILGVLPQNPQSIFVKKTLLLDLAEMLSEMKLSKEEKDERIYAATQLCRIERLLDRHPYDLSGGEQQRAALCKVLLKSPEILLLDEPTKGLDAHFKMELADILCDLKANGVTIVMVSHDIEFCAEFADRCALFFDGCITSEGKPREFFSGKNFYTTAANRMARTTIPKAVLAEDILLAFGMDIPKPEKRTPPPIPKRADTNEYMQPMKTKKCSLARRVFGILFVLLFALTSVVYVTEWDVFSFAKVSVGGIEVLQIVVAAEIVIAFLCLFPAKVIGTQTVQTPRSDRKLTKRTLCAMALILLFIPLTIYIGVYFLGDRKYYFISLLILLETMIPFMMVFEDRHPTARELVLISVLCAIAVAGRTAFYMLPQFKPVVALVIIVGVNFGGETGFLVGSVTGFVSNFFFGQGAWTPWQMFAFGIIGFVAGVLFKKGLLRKMKASLCIFGFFATVILYGGIMNPASVIILPGEPTKELILSALLVGLPMDIIHAVSTVFFLWFLSEPMTDKLERIKIKYGLVER